MKPYHAKTHSAALTAVVLFVSTREGNWTGWKLPSRNISSLPFTDRPASLSCGRAQPSALAMFTSLLALRDTFLFYLFILIFIFSQAKYLVRYLATGSVRVTVREEVKACVRVSLCNAILFKHQML